MNETLTITKAALAGLFDILGYPNPDDPGPWGPIGPVIRDEAWSRLGPIPIPWRPIGSIADRAWTTVMGPYPIPWRRNGGPLPDPWRSAWLARAVIDQSVGMVRWAESGGVSEEQGAATLSSSRFSIREFVDEFCGTTRPGRFPRPWPWPLGPALASNPVELILAGAQFQKAATGFDSPLAGDFASAADVLFATGLKRLAGTGEQAQSAAADSVCSAI